jgi:23S rRNA (cytosine1962-C5)-methyltransferase
MKPPFSESYALLDSGHGLKLERFGDKSIVRPSSLSVWKQRLPRERWTNADAAFDPERGWSFRGTPFDSWRFDSDLCTLVLRPQTNGQIGIFPEHAAYLEAVKARIGELRSTQGAVQVLNLFAYTGMASMVAAKAGASVTHLDLAKRALDWARENIAANELPEGAVRLIPEDALIYLARQAKKEQRYDIIIADPPSFSRITAKKTWSLDEVSQELVRLLLAVLEPTGGELFLTSHHFELGAHTFRNLLIDELHGTPHSIELGELSMREEDSPRILPAGFLVHTRLG